MVESEFLDESFPEIFDPYGETQPDYQSGYYDADSNTFVCGDRQIDIPENLQRATDQMLSQNQDPTPTLRQALEQLMQENQPEEADDCLPETMFEILDDNVIKFKDAVFAGPTLRSLQKCKQKDIKGWIIMPASFSARIRSRRANHNVITPALYLPEEALDLSAYFTNNNAT